MIVEITEQSSASWRAVKVPSWRDAGKKTEAVECPRCGYLADMDALPTLHECTGRDAPEQLKRWRRDECIKQRRRRNGHGF